MRDKSGKTDWPETGRINANNDSDALNEKYPGAGTTIRQGGKPAFSDTTGFIDPTQKAQGGRVRRTGRATGGILDETGSKSRRGHGYGVDPQMEGDPPPSLTQQQDDEGQPHWKVRDGGHVAFRTPAGSVSAGARREAEGKGEAMPGGRFPIRSAADLSNAKHDYGRANDKPAVKRWINKRAKDLGEPPLGG